MNGRLYDPQLGRFLSPDAQIQYPDQTQSFNRYTYVNNNPLSYTDPSGYGFFSKLWKKIKRFVREWGRVIIAAIVASIVGPWVYNQYFWANAAAGTFSTVTSLTIQASVIAGAVSGFAAGLIISGGDFKGALYGALSGAAFGYVAGQFGKVWNMKRVLANASIGGTSAKLQGGKFSQGFLVAGVSASARHLYNRVVGYDTTFESGGDAVGKDSLDRPVEGANNIGTQSAPVDSSSFWAEGGPLSRVANTIPGINAIAGFHDVLQVSLGEGIARNIFNIPGMLPATVITGAGLLDGVVAVQAGVAGPSKLPNDRVSGFRPSRSVRENRRILEACYIGVRENCLASYVGK